MFTFGHGQVWTCMDLKRENKEEHKLKLND